MKRGFQILLHKDIPAKYIDAAKAECDRFIVIASSEKGYRTGGQNSSSFYQRGILGREVSNTERSIVFRRLVKNRRVFGIVPVSSLVNQDGSDVKLEHCMCSYHDGGKRVRFKDGFKQQDFVQYYETGDIKG